MGETCCPECLLIPSQAGSLSPSCAVLKMAAYAGIAPATLTSSPPDSLALSGCAPRTLSHAAFGARLRSTGGCSS